MTTRDEILQALDNLKSSGNDIEGTAKNCNHNEQRRVPFPLGSEHNPARALEELPNGTGVVANKKDQRICWFKDGQLHREDGPALIWYGRSFFFLHGDMVNEAAFYNNKKSQKKHLRNFFKKWFYGELDKK